MNIIHDETIHEFRTETSPYYGVLLYAVEKKRLDFYHVYVREPLRGKGAAGSLVKTAFEYAKEHGFKVTATCPFISGDFLSRFPEYQSLVEPGTFSFDKSS